MEEIDRIQSNIDGAPDNLPDAVESEAEPGATRLAPIETRALGELGISEVRVNRAQETIAGETTRRERLSLRERLVARREEQRIAHEKRPLKPAQVATRGLLAELRRDSRKDSRRRASRSRPTSA